MIGFICPRLLISFKYLLRKNGCFALCEHSENEEILRVVCCINMPTFRIDLPCLFYLAIFFAKSKGAEKIVKYKSYCTLFIVLLKDG